MPPKYRVPVRKGARLLRRVPARRTYFRRPVSYLQRIRLIRRRKALLLARFLRSRPWLRKAGIYANLPRRRYRR